MSYMKQREFQIVRMEETRREYVCVEQQERGDDVWYDRALMELGYMLDWPADSRQATEMQDVMNRHGYRRILAMRHLSAHDLIRVRSLPNPRRLVLTIELP